MELFGLTLRIILSFFFLSLSLVLVSLYRYLIKENILKDMGGILPIIKFSFSLSLFFDTQG